MRRDLYFANKVKNNNKELKNKIDTAYEMYCNLSDEERYCNKSDFIGRIMHKYNLTYCPSYRIVSLMQEEYGVTFYHTHKGAGNFKGHKHSEASKAIISAKLSALQLGKKRGPYKKIFTPVPLQISTCNIEI